MMPELTRRRIDERFATWEIWYEDVQVGAITQQEWDPNPVRSGFWKWSCGFYPIHRDQCFRGAAPTFGTAHAAFSGAWKMFLPQRTEAEFEASRRQNSGRLTNTLCGMPDIETSSAEANPVSLRRDV
jgi:hypothetical protein